MNSFLNSWIAFVVGMNICIHRGFPGSNLSTTIYRFNNFFLSFLSEFFPLKCLYTCKKRPLT
uniref:Uncharacterized protein n=1 Tax=Anguilla anguilla TaxID=7936 RepID=A0A0E9X3X2_ANGAN